MKHEKRAARSPLLTSPVLLPWLSGPAGLPLSPPPLCGTGWPGPARSAPRHRHLHGGHRDAAEPGCDDPESRVPCVISSPRRSPYHGCGPRGAGADRERRLRAARPGPAAGISGTAAGGAGRGRAGAAPTAASLLAPAPGIRDNVCTGTSIGVGTAYWHRAPVPRTVHHSVHQCHGPSAGTRHRAVVWGSSAGNRAPALGTECGAPSPRPRDSAPVPGMGSSN